MAFSGMSWQQYGGHQKLSSRGGMDVTDNSNDLQEIHLKMSKKIAQLTKVIYTLNTKNDEHETIVSALKENHEEEIQKVLTSSTSKLQEIKNKMNNDSQMTIDFLQNQVKSLEEDKRKWKREIEEYKMSQEASNLQKERERAELIDSMTRDLMEAKQAFEVRSREFTREISQVEREKSKKDDSKQAELQRQIADLKRKIDSQELNFAKQISEVERDRDVIKSDLSHVVLNHEEEMNKFRAECDAKVEKSKTFYERELDAALQDLKSKRSLASGWEEEVQKMRIEMDEMKIKHRKKIKEVENQKEQIKELIQRLEEKEEEQKEGVKELKKLQESLLDLQGSYDEVKDHWMSLTSEVDSLKIKMKSQVNDLAQKSSIIGTLEAIKLTQDESISDLEEQLISTKKKLSEAENKKNRLIKDQDQEDQTRLNQIRTLASKLEKLQNEQQVDKKEYLKKLAETKEVYEKDLKEAQLRYESSLDDSKRKYSSEIEAALKKVKEEAEKVQIKLIKEHDEEKKLLESKLKEKIEEELKQKQEMSINLVELKDKISQQTESLEEKNKDNKNLLNKIEEISKQLNISCEENKESKRNLLTSQKTIQKLKEELDGLKTRCTNENTSVEKKHIEALEKLKRDKDEEFSKTLRCKLSELRSKLNHQLSAENKKAIEEVIKEKSEEFEAIKLGWQSQIKQLTTQKTELRNKLENEKNEICEKLSKSEKSFENLEKIMKEKEMKISDEFEEKINQLIQGHEKDLKDLKEDNEKRLEDLKEELETRHRKESHSQMKTHQVVIDSVRCNLLDEHQRELQRREEEFETDLDELRSKLMQQHLENMEEAKKTLEEEIAQMTSQLEDSELKNQNRETAAKMKISELELKLETFIKEKRDLEDQTEDQMKEISTLKTELEAKVKDIFQTRSEANLEIRRREDEIIKRFEDEQNEIEADNLRSRQNLVNDFNRASGLLQEKIAQLKITIHDWEDRYENRESRTDDLELISHLQGLIRERELELERIENDKKFFEMELVNREMNFNKVFNSNPNVGVLNPRGKKKKNLSSSNRMLEPLHQTVSSSSPHNGRSLQPTPPNLPRKIIRTLSAQHRVSKDFFSEEASSQLDSYISDYEEETEDLKRRRSDRNHDLSVRRNLNKFPVWKSELNLSMNECQDSSGSNLDTKITDRNHSKKRGGWFLSSLRKKK